jgi:hypothetical protein
VGRNSAVGIEIRYGLDGPGIESQLEVRFSVPLQNGPGAHLASYIIGTGPFSGINLPGRGVDHPSQSKAKVQERVDL